MKKKEMKLKTKQVVNDNEENYISKGNQKNTRKITIKLISGVLIVVMLTLTVGMVLISVKPTGESEEAGIQAMAQKGDYIKNIEKVTESNEYMDIYIDENEEKVPIPKGYVGSSVDGENTVKGGYVIYEKTDEEIKNNMDVKITDNNKWNEMKTRNQYVWVPVPDVSKMYGIDANGKLWGKLYEFTTDTGIGIDPKTGTKPFDWIESNGVMLLGVGGFREPDVIKDSDTPRNFKQCEARTESALEHLMNLEKEFETSIESIAKYGGFYIGRYETGGLNAEAKVVRMDTNINSQTWYSMYEKCKKLSGANKNVVTSMIFGSQFDRALMWIIESDNEIGIEDVEKDSAKWGNYINVQLEYEKTDGNTRTKYKGENTIIPAGSSEQTKANNIYDLCGNVYDWTIEAGDTWIRVSRGGYCLTESTGNPADTRNQSGPKTAQSNYGCRAALFIR